MQSRRSAWDFGPRRSFGSTISRPRHSRAGAPGRKPRQLVQCDEPALRRWGVATQSADRRKAGCPEVLQGMTPTAAQAVVGVVAFSACAAVMAISPSAGVLSGTSTPCRLSCLLEVSMAPQMHLGRYCLLVRSDRCAWTRRWSSAKTASGLAYHLRMTSIGI